ncbi:MAG: LamG-like jellyroll fold domain-containing protein, partial [Psychroserpens sp.]|uniref:LamG-like jellyroll fold domain-containing protein n=1 Tax=Psychroserpens sp. TaxID=2020870 RepID=UPI003002C8F0
WIYDDGNGNTSTQTQTVIVNDVTAPVADIATLADATGECSASVTAPSATDNCEGTITGTTSDPTSYSAQGTYTVNWIYDDGNGNTSTQTQTVIVNDVTAPVADVATLADITGECEVTTLTDPAATDNCVGTVTVTHDATLPISGEGTTTVVTWTYDDGNGNTSTQTQNVIIDDVSNPLASCQNITVQLDPGGTINISPLDIDNGSSDNCGIQSITVNPMTFTCADVGANTVTLTVTDINGNVGTCTSTVTVEDITPPTTIPGECGNLEVTIDSATGQIVVSQAQVDALYTGSDPCGIQSVTLAQTTFGCTEVGVNSVQLTILDVNGNSSNCLATITINAPVITTGTLTGLVVDPIPDNPVPADDLIEVTSCPGGVAVPKDIQLTLNLDASSTITASNVSTWQISTDNGETWTNVSGSAGQLQITLLDRLETTLVRVVVQTGNCVEFSPLAVIRFLPADVPPTIVSVSNTEICLGETVDITAESFFEGPGGGQFGTGGLFNQANPENWLVDGIESLPAPGNNTDPGPWFESNGPKIFSGIRYDTGDNTKFVIANGIVDTTLETPIFNTVGMTASEAILEFHQGYYLCNGAYAEIRLSLDGGVTYDIVLSTIQGDNYTSGNNTGFQVNGKNGTNCGNGNNGQHPTSDPLQLAQLDLGAYAGMANLRVMFSYFGASSTECTNINFPAHPGNTCSPIPTTFDVYSSWVIDDVGFPYTYIEEELEWTDEDGVIISTNATVSVTPVTPGIREVGVTSLVNGCRAATDDGTEFVSINASLAYAGQDFSPTALECGQSTINLRGYDNVLTAVQNFNLGAWESGLYTVPNIIAGDTNFVGTGIVGSWSILNTSNGACGTSVTFSSLANPRATFTADPGTYTLRWTLANGCFDDVIISINSCNNIDFDGTDDFVSLKDNYALTSGFSIENWVKPVSVAGNNTIFSKKNASDNSRGYVLNIDNGIVKFNWFNLAGSGTIASQYAIDTSRWYHIAVTYDGATYALYIDGIDVGVISGSVNPPLSTTSDAEALVGALDNDIASNNNVTNLYHGWIDELRIWNTALTTAQIRQMMNQEIVNNTAVRGVVVPLDIPGLSWTDLDGYYRMDVACGFLQAYKGVRGRLRNMNSSQQETAPIPYTSRVDGQDWPTDNTWTNFNVWNAPNSLGIDGITPIDWNIVQTSHNITSGDKDIIVLGLISDTPNKVLAITDPGSAQNETNVGQSLRVTHYLNLDGDIDLFGESQLLQDEGSILEVTSSGKLERDQQGSANLYNYNYLSSPVSAFNITSNNNPYGIATVLRDGTNSATPLNLQWTTAQDADGSTTPITQSSRWLYAYENYAVGNTPEEGYAQWRDLAETDVLATGLSFTMKGSGAGNPVTDVQNYVFIGKPNNGTITTPLTIGNQALVGNPYPSAIDANQFIRDNLPGGSGNPGSTQSTDGTLYFWEHYTSNFTHILEDYEGGYATYNLSGGNQAVSGPLVSGIGTPTKLPGQYIPVSQGFFVTASNVGGNIQFKNSQRVFEREALASSQFFRTSNPNMYSSQEDPNPEIQRVRLNFKTEEGAIRPLLLAFVPNSQATDGFDYGYDAENSDDEFPNDMFWRIGDGNYTTQGVGDFDDTKQYPLVAYVNSAGMYEVSLNGLENFDEAITVYVYDALLDTYFDITTETFQIALDADTYANRFYITFSSDSTLSISEEELSQKIISFFNTTQEIYVRTTNISEVKSIKLINLLGQEIMSWDNTSEFELDGAIRIPVKNLSEGAYVIKVDTHTSTFNAKVIVKQ